MNGHKHKSTAPTELSIENNSRLIRIRHKWNQLNKQMADFTNILNDHSIKEGSIDTINQAKIAQFREWARMYQTREKLCENIHDCTPEMYDLAYQMLENQKNQNINNLQLYYKYISRIVRLF